ncbi:MAG: hypothetical protein OIF47_10810 [Marinibacterium sp.]|nr:hypothetical protein [Marinibacterium sp.]
MLKVMGSVAVMALVAGCVQTSPSVLGTGAPVQDPRDVALETNATLDPPQEVTAQVLAPAQNTSIELQQALQTDGSIAAASSGGVPGASGVPAGDPLIAGANAALAGGAVVAPVPGGDNASLSDEQDFSAVSGRQTIQSDADRIAAAAAVRETVQPTELPQRDAGASPNIVAYALSSSNPRGTRIYSRTGINLQNRAQRACAGYPSPDQAQIDFLASGGPQRDRKGLDPDGDGYACAWDPAPFRAAVQG